MKKDEIHFILVEKQLDGQFKSLGKIFTKLKQLYKLLRKVIGIIKT